MLAPDPKFKSLDFEGFVFSVSRGVDDRAIVLSIDSGNAKGPDDHLPNNCPRITIFLNDVDVYNFEGRLPVADMRPVP